MGLIDDLKKWAHPYEDEDEEYEDDFAELGSRDTGAFADERPSATATRTAATRSSTSTRRRSSRSCSSSPSALRMPARSPTT